MTPDLKAHVLDRLAETGVDNEEWSFLVVAALDGPDALDNYLVGRSIGKTDREGRGPVSPKPARTQRAKAEAKTEAEPPGVYVSSITVEGFRGIGQGATLCLRPGPGLTLVVGRNGSGKSSFAEGLEVLLTGQNYRWLKRALSRRVGHSRGRKQPLICLDSQTPTPWEALALKVDAQPKGDVATSRLRVDQGRLPPLFGSDRGRARLVPPADVFVRRTPLRRASRWVE